MPKIVVEVADDFSAFGTDYAIGDILPDSEFAAWPDGTVENRLKNGFLKHRVLPDTPKPVLDLSDLEAQTSEELIEIAAAYGVKIDEEVPDLEKIRRIRLIAEA